MGQDKFSKGCGQATSSDVQSVKKSPIKSPGQKTATDQPQTKTK